MTFNLIFCFWCGAGTVNWALPGTVGNGDLTNNWVIKFGGIHGELSTHLLLCTGFARMALLGVSMNCGFIGGIVFPFLSMGIIAGTVAYQHYPEVPLGLFISAFMVALPCGIVPMPITFTCLSAFSFFLGLNQTVPIFVAVITSFSLVCSSGLMKGLVERSQKREQAERDAENSAKAGQEGGGGGGVGGSTSSHKTAHHNNRSQAERERSKKEAEEFALNHYLGNQKKAVQTA
jgi:H+/Cl- antiporter ClcA